MEHGASVHSNERRNPAKRLYREIVSIQDNPVSADSTEVMQRA